MEVVAYIADDTGVFQTVYLNPVDGFVTHVGQDVCQLFSCDGLDILRTVAAQVQMCGSAAFADIVQFFAQQIVLCHNLSVFGMPAKII